jgi:hypothetical protein
MLSLVCLCFPNTASLASAAAAAALLKNIPPSLQHRPPFVLGNNGAMAVPAVGLAPGAMMGKNQKCACVFPCRMSCYFHPSARAFLHPTIVFNRSDKCYATLHLVLYLNFLDWLLTAAALLSSCAFRRHTEATRGATFELAQVRQS